MLITSLKLFRRDVLKDYPTSLISLTFYLYKKNIYKKKISASQKVFRGLISIKAYVIINYKLYEYGFSREEGNVRSILEFILGSILGFTLEFT